MGPEGVAIRGYAYDLDGGSELFGMNSHSRRVCVIISANKEFVIMKAVAKTTLMVHLSRLEDPRTGQNTRHKFIEVLFIAVCGVISGCECWTEIEDYGQAKEQWLRGFLDRGIPSHDTLRRLFVF